MDYKRGILVITTNPEGNSQYFLRILSPEKALQTPFRKVNYLF